MKSSFFIRLNKKNVKVNFTDILYVEGCKNYVKIVTLKEKYLTLLSMSRMEELLPISKFFRVHKSYIVSLDHISAFDAHNIYFNDSLSVPIGGTYKDHIVQRIQVVNTGMYPKPEMHVSCFGVTEIAN